jgi:hypothetical protein
MEHDKFALIILFTADLALVFIMFLGLLRFLSRGGGMFGMGCLLWQQVRWCPW